MDLDLSVAPIPTQLPSIYFIYGDVDSSYSDLIGYLNQVFTVGLFATVNPTDTKSISERCGDMRLLIKGVVSNMRHEPVGSTDTTIDDARIISVKTIDRKVNQYHRLFFKIAFAFEESV